jgi:2-dehydro-3-deoxyphosphogluconate aldolase / (4S)-4-hydroxy-2-oxoglutarate aldolase
LTTELDRYLAEDRVLAIVREGAAADAQATATALIEGGIRVVEFSLTGAGALESLAVTAERYADRALLGAGTVLSVDDAVAAVERGASFLVSPAYVHEVVTWGTRSGLPVIPGAMTPGEVLAAHRGGAALIKIFPIGGFGPRYVRDLLAPFPALRLLPTGGVTLDDAAAYIRAGAAAVALATALTAGSDYERISERAADLLRRVKTEASDGR